MRMGMWHARGGTVAYVLARGSCGGCQCPLACLPALQGRLASVLSAAEVARVELTTVAAVAEAACAPGAPPLSRVHASRTVLASLPLALTRAPIPAPAPLGYQPPDVDPVLPIGCITGGDQVPGRAEAGAADQQVRDYRVWHRARSPLRTVSHALVRTVLVCGCQDNDDRQATGALTVSGNPGRKRGGAGSYRTLRFVCVWSDAGRTLRARS